MLSVSVHGYSVKMADMLPENDAHIIVKKQSKAINEKKKKKKNDLI